MRTCVILNPTAGTANRERLQAALANVPGAVLRVSEAAGEVDSLATAAVDRGAELVVAAGGDGTVAEVVNALAKRDWRARFGVLPVGTCNDFARALGIPVDLDQALKALTAGVFRPIDVIRLRANDLERFFVLVSASGFRPDVEERIEEQFKSHWGPFGYVAAASEALPAMTNYRVGLTLGDEQGHEATMELDISNLVVANVRIMGGGVPIAPSAEPDDGRMDVVAIRAGTPGEMVMLAPQLLLGTHLGSETVVHAICSRLVVRSEPPLPFHADGVHVTADTFKFRVLPRVLEVAVPAPPAA